MGLSSSKNIRYQKLKEDSEYINQNNENNSKNSKIYSDSEVNDLFNEFMENDLIQSFFYSKKTDDETFNKLKSEELDKLLEFYNSNKKFYKNYFESSLNKRLIPEIKDLVKEFTFKDNNYGKYAYQYKIEQCIQRIEKNKDLYEIKHLTIMLVGKSGVGKSTLINNILKLDKNQKAKTGTGKFQTEKINEYQSENIPFLRLVDTRGIELNLDYGAEAVKNDAIKYINKQTNLNNVNNFVHCIWYCITGNRFEQVEIDLLNSLRNSYCDNQIPIIIVYTQATDNNTIDEMQNYIKEKNIDANFIKVLAERKKLVNNSYLSPFGKEELIKKTLEKCKNALKGKMFSVITKNMSEYILQILKEQNDLDKQYIYRKMKLSVTQNYTSVREKDNFIEFVIYLLGFNIIIFFERKETRLNYESKQKFLNSSIINDFLELVIKDYEQKVEEIITPLLKNQAIIFIDLQVSVQKKYKKEIFYENQRNIEDFKNTIRNFLCDNFHYIGQKLILNFIFKKIYELLSNEFVNQTNSLCLKIINEENIKEQIKQCYLKKYNEFENKVSSFNYHFTENIELLYNSD